MSTDLTTWIHLRATERDLRRLRRIARAREQPTSVVLRSLIRTEHARLARAKKKERENGKA